MKTVAFSILGTTLDRRGRGKDRWQRWRPTVSLCQQDDLIIDRLELLFDNHSEGLAKQVTEDIAIVSPETEVRYHKVNFDSPWDFESVYGELLDVTRAYPFDSEQEEYLVHITTGTHVAQICWYLLTEARYLPAKLIQTSPKSAKSNSARPSSAKPNTKDKSIEPPSNHYQIIDLDLSKYDQIASRFRQEHQEGTSYLKSGIDTRNLTFNKMIEQIEQVSIRSSEPLLITGPTGAGKSHLAKKVFLLRQQRRRLSGQFVAVNCATLRGDNAMSALFGHKKGAFTGATTDRPGLLMEANKGMLFLDEIGELGLDEQAMLLRAIEDKCFIPLGSDRESSSDFQLIAGTNQNLVERAQQGHFREDLLARIDLWSYQLPSLKERIEDIEPNIDFELDRFSKKSGLMVRFNQAARDEYMRFSLSPKALWSANFRDLNASITRMGTLSEGGRITVTIVQEEIGRLEKKWNNHSMNNQLPKRPIERVLGPHSCDTMDYLDQIKLAGIIEVCQQSQSMAEAGRTLFQASRLQKKTSNDSHRVKQLLAKYGLTFDDINKACKY